MYKVFCITTNKVYDSVANAANAVHIDKSCIYKQLAGKTLTANGCRWLRLNGNETLEDLQEIRRQELNKYHRTSIF